MSIVSLGTSILFANTLIARTGITIDGTNILDHHTPWIPWTPTVISGQAGPITSTGTKYKQIGDTVTILLVLDFIHISPGGPITAIVLASLPIAASMSAEYHNGLNISVFNGVTDTFGFGRLEIDPGISPTQLTLRNSVVYTAGFPFTTRISGQITYKAA